MKKNDSLKVKTLKPKKKTIDFLLNYSRSIDCIRAMDKNFVITKN